MRDKLIAYGMSPFSLYEKLKYEQRLPVTLADCKDLFNRYNRTFKEAIGWLKTQQKLASTQFFMCNMNGRKRSWSKPNGHRIRALVEEEMTKKGKIKLTDHVRDNELPLRVQEKYDATIAAIQREGANCQIQTVNADMTKDAMAKMRKEFKRLKYDARMYNSVYDEIVLDVHKSCAEEVHEIQKRIMVEEANKMLKKVPMQVEGHLTSCWTK